MLCPIHGTELKHVELVRRCETMLCTPRSRRARPHPVTIFYYDEGFQLEIYDRDIDDPEEEESDD